MIDHFRFLKYWNMTNILKKLTLIIAAYAAKIIPNSFDKDELTLAKALKQGGVEWPLWQEAIRKELSSMIIDNEVFEPIEYKDVPIESKIFNLLILLKRKRDQHKEITK